MRLVLFDIDGTLLWTDGAGRRAIHRALLDETGSTGPVEGYRFDGKTDPQIVRELMVLVSPAEGDVDGRVAAVLDRYLALLEAELARPAHATTLLPGVRELLDALGPIEAEGGALVGLLTGNLARGAALKLRSAGLDPDRFAVGAFGSDSARRSDLPPVAARRAAARTGRPFAGRDLVIIGDTPADMECGAPVGARAVGVATGSYDVATLAAAGAGAAFGDLSDTAAVLEAILAP
jgi:phosphoglycolate phosphatase-like HAD superfamily hydrolase